MRLRHAILGVGGVGGTVGTLLAHLGDSVTVVVKTESFATYPDQLHLESPFGNFTASVVRAKEVPACDVLWLTIKATQLDAALRAVTPAEAVGAIVPLLNGIDHLSVLRAKFGNDRVIAATIAGEMERISPGEFVHRSPFLRLNVSSAGQTLLSGAIEGLQKIGVECRFIEDEPTLMWGKLVFLAAFALTTTASEKTTGEILTDPEWRQLGLSVIREACAVAVAEGAKLDADAVIAGVMKMPGNMRSSMQKDVAQGKPPELDAIAGPILRGGYRHGIVTPATQRLADAVRARSVGAGNPQST